MELESIEFLIIILGCHWAGIVRGLVFARNSSFAGYLRQALISGFVGSLVVFFAIEYHQTIAKVAFYALLGAYCGTETIERFTKMVGNFGKS